MTLQNALSYARPTFHWPAAILVVTYVVATSFIVIPQFSPLGIALWLVVGLVVSAIAVGMAAMTTQVRHRALDEFARVRSELDAERTARHQVENDQRRLLAACEARATALRHVEQQQLPALLQDAPAPPLPEINGDDMAYEVLRRISGFSRQIGEQQLSRIAGTEKVLVALSRSVQANAHRIQEQTTRALERHQNDPDVLETCMQVDHAAAQQARRAQTLAVLCGEEPGQQWRDPLPLEDVVRAASARITAYQRVEVPGDSGLAIAAHVVEPAIHLVAELLANATQLSPPTTTVPVAVRQVQRGAVIEIDDGGVGVNDTEIDDLRRIASGRRTIRLAELGESPRTGLAVVGRYVQRHGFRVDLTHSVYGGVRAIVLVPAEYVVLAPSTGQMHSPPPAPGLSTPSLPESTAQVQQAIPAGSDPAPPTPDPVPMRHEPAAAEHETSTAQHAVLPDGLPRRRSRRREAAPDDRVAEPGAVEWPGETGDLNQRSPEEEGQWMAAFLNATPGTSTKHHALTSDDTEDA